MIKKIRSRLTICLALIIAFSSISSSATYITGTWDKGIPETGILLKDDLESYTDHAYMRRKNEDGPWYNSATGSLITYKDNKAITSVRRNMDPNTVSFLQWNNWTPYGKQNDTGMEISTGKLLLQYDVMIPDNGFEYTDYEAQRSGWYLCSHSLADYEKNDLTKRAYLSTVWHDYQGEGPKLWFQTSNFNIHYNAPVDGATVSLEKEKWYTVSTLINYDTGIVTHYVDGKPIKSLDVGSEISTKFPMYFLTWNNLSKGLEDGDVYPDVLIDNFLIERLSTVSTPLTVSAKEYDAKQVDITFSSVIDTSRLTKDDFSINIFGENTKVSPSAITTVNGTTVRLTFANNLQAGSLYELQTNIYIENAFDSANVLAKGTKIYFTTGLSPVDTVLLDQNFENVTWPTEEEGKRNVDFVEVYNSYMPNENSTTNPSVYGTYDNWKFAKENREDLYIKPITFNGSTMMQIDMTSPMSVAQSANDVLLPFTKSVSSGILEIEFNVVKHSPGSYQLGFGLHDTAYAEVDASYNPMSDRSASTLLGGYTYWSGWKTSLVANYEEVEYRNHLPDGYAYPGNTKPNTGTWKDVSTSVLIEEQFAPVADLNSNVIRKWKFVVDLDKNTYDIYIDGSPVKSFDYIPGGNGGTYDAFTINSMITTNDSTVSSSTNRSTLLDNIKVIHKDLPLAFEGVSYVDEEGNIENGYVYESADIQKMILHFNQEVASSSLSYITISGKNDTAYTLTKNGKDVIIDFPDGLTNCLEYTVSIGKDLSSTNGSCLDKTFTLPFKTHAVNAFIARGICYKEYNGNLQHGTVIAPGTEKAVITFSNPIDEATLSNITVTGGGTMYTVEKENNSAVITFLKPLLPETNYTVSVAKGFADEYGNIFTEDLTYDFSTDEGEYIVGEPLLKSENSILFNTSAVTVGQKLKAFSTIINTTDTSSSAVLLVAAYKNDCMTFVATSPTYTTDKTLFENEITFDFTATEDFVGADCVKLFVWNNANDVMPLTIPTIIDNNAGNVGYVLDVSDSDTDGLSIRLLNSAGKIEEIALSKDIRIDTCLTGENTIEILRKTVGKVILYKINKNGSIFSIDTDTTNNRETGTTLQYRGETSSDYVADRYADKNFGGRFLCSDDTLLFIVNTDHSLRDAYYRVVGLDSLTSNVAYDADFYKITDSSYIDVVVIKENSIYNMPYDTRYVMVNNVTTDTNGVAKIEGYIGTNTVSYNVLSTLSKQYHPKKGDLVRMGFTPYDEVAAIECHYDMATNGENTWTTPGSPFYGFSLKLFWQRTTDKYRVSRAIIGHVVSLDGTVLSWGYDTSESGLTTVAEVADITDVPILVYDMKTETFRVGSTADIICAVKDSTNYSNIVGEMSYGKFQAIYIINNRNA